MERTLSVHGLETLQDSKRAEKELTFLDECLTCFKQLVLNMHEPTSD